MDTSKMDNMLNGAFGKSIKKRKQMNHNISTNRPREESTKEASLSKAKTVRETTTGSTHEGMIPWSLALDYRSIGILDALEKLYGLSNRDEALQLLFNKPLNELVTAKGVEGKEKFELNRKVYDMNTRPKAIARHKKFGR